MLRDLQRHFARAVFEEHPAIHAAVRDGRFPAAQHVQLYRHNINETFTTALAAVYPVTEQLVGKGFFGYAIHEYLRDHRPLSPALHDFGGTLADFLTGFAPAAMLPYLPDVARLEWAWHRAFHAAEAPAFDPAILANLPSECLPDLHFTLHPSAHVVQSRWPIAQIFEAHQDGAHVDGAVDLDAGGETVLVIRRGLTVAVETLRPGTAALLSTLHHNRTLDNAVQAALEAEPGFDLRRALADHVQRGTFTELHTA